MEQNNKKEIILKKLPAELGITSLAIIFAIGDMILNTLEISLKRPGSLTMGQVLKTLEKRKNFWYFYEKIKDTNKNNFQVTLHRLRKRGLIKKENNKFQLSFAGLKLFKEIKNNNKIWDGKWRIAMFDIPEKFRRERNWLRRELYNLGYKLFQKSVFIGKWTLSESFYKEIKEKEINKYINLITVGELDDERILNSFD
jgi:CRISPR-associated endonuclease Cas2